MIKLRTLAAIVLCIFISRYDAFGQAYQMHLFSSWDDPELVARSGIRYNDIWGYEAGGRRYAMFGSVRYSHFFDVTSPETPVEVARIASLNLANGNINNTIWRDFKTFGTYAYGVADEGKEGLCVYDLSDLPAGVTRIYQDTTWFTRAHNIYVDVPEGRLYVAGVGNNLIVYDLFANPAAPVHLATLDLRNISGIGSTYVHDVYVRNDTAYCSHGFSGYCAYDLRDIQSPQVINCINFTQGYNHSSWVSDDGEYIVYAEELPQGKPLVVLHRDSFLMNETSYFLPFREPLLAPAHLDITPHNPFFKGDTLFVSYYEDGVVAFDMSDPYNPVRMAYYDTYPENTDYNGTVGCWGVYPYFSNGLIAGSDTKNGLFLMELDLGALAVDIKAFSADCSGSGETALSYELSGDRALESVTLEGSVNGVDFAAEQELNATAWSATYRFGPTPDYLRLRIAETGGKTYYSRIITGCPDKAGKILFSPNPAGAAGYVQAVLPLTATPVIRVSDVYGRILKQINGVRLENGRVRWSTEGLVPGMYIFGVETARGPVSQLVVVH